MSNLQGTTVPSNAFVEKVYINVDLSIEEVVSIIDSANLTYDFFSKYTVVDGIEISTLRAISVNNEVVFRESDPLNVGVFVGWKEGFNGIVAVNKQNSYGTQNDALSSLFSITPLTQAQDGQVIVSKSKLTAIADNIRNQTGTTGLITLDEMAKMKLGGTDTSDATATSEDILLGKTAYVNDVKVVGTIEEYDGSYDGGIDNTQEDGLIDGTLTEYSNNRVTEVRSYAFTQNKTIVSVNMPNVTNIGSSAFRGCTALISVSLPKLTNAGYATFDGCTALTSISLPNAKSTGYETFKGCTALISVDISNVTSIGDNVFDGCTALTNVSLPLVTTICPNAFRSCSSLISVNISQVFTIDYLSFAECYNLKAVIIKQEEKVCTLANTTAFRNCYHILGTVNSSHNPNGDKDGFIYVPDSLVDQYRQATNWSTYADQIRALEDYTVDGTTTGDLDESKVNA